MAKIELSALRATPAIRSALSDMLIEVVAGGGSVSFMHPLAAKAAQDFWDGALAAALRNERVILGAFDAATLVGTVSLLLDCPPNQPHRAEIAKLMTRPSHRGRGIARTLMQEAERIAIERARTLIVLDTAADGGAAALYEALGYRFAELIPDYALKPHGGLTATMIYWKRLAGHPGDL